MSLLLWPKRLFFVDLGSGQEITEAMMFGASPGSFVINFAYRPKHVFLQDEKTGIKSQLTSKLL
jgi:hypothetical protein